MTDKLSIEPLTPERWGDLVDLFSRPGLSVARGCYCMYYRRSGSWTPPSGVTRSMANKRALRALVRRGIVPGLLGYRKGRAIGWVSLGPREDYAKLERSQVMKPVDDKPVWSIICFVVDPRERRAGIAEAMLASAVAWARKNRVKLLEAYPCDKNGRSADDSMWFGAKPMFDRAGFAEVARRKPGRPVVRKALGSGRLSGRTSDREPVGLRGRTSIRKKGAGR